MRVMTAVDELTVAMRVAQDQRSRLPRLRQVQQRLRARGDRAFEAAKIDYIHRTGEFTPDRDKYIFSYLAQRGARPGRSAMSDATGSGNTAPDPATADNPPQDIGAGDQARDPEGSAAHQSDQRDAGISGDQMPAGDQGG
jgi:hypothetical protein